MYTEKIHKIERNKIQLRQRNTIEKKKNTIEPKKKKNTPAKVVVIHRGKVVMDERHGVDHLRAHGRGHGGLHRAPEHLAGGDGKDGPHALAPGHQGVTHRFAYLKKKRGGIGVGSGCEGVGGKGVGVPLIPAW